MSADYDAELKKLRGKVSTHVFPDGTCVDFEATTKIKCPEALFRPSMINKSCLGIDTILPRVLLKSSAFTQATMCENMVCVGGTSLFTGFAERVKRALSDHNVMSQVLTPSLLLRYVRRRGFLPKTAGSLRAEYEAYASSRPKREYELIAPPERKYSTFIGGSIFADFFRGAPCWITKDEYAEFGPSIASRKFSSNATI